MTARAVFSPRAPRRLPRTFRADADRGWIAGAPATDRHHSARRIHRALCGSTARRQRHHRGHRAWQHPDSRIERGIRAAFCRQCCSARNRHGRRRFRSRQSARRSRSDGNPGRWRARRRYSPRRRTRRARRKACAESLGRGRRRRTLNLDDVAADVRLRAERVDRAVALRVSLGGDGANATQLGAVAPADGVEAVIRLLEVIARHGRTARARDILATERTCRLSFRN